MDAGPVLPAVVAGPPLGDGAPGSVVPFTEVVVPTSTPATVVVVPATRWMGDVDFLLEGEMTVRPITAVMRMATHTP